MDIQPVDAWGIAALFFLANEWYGIGATAALVVVALLVQNWRDTR